MSQYHICVVSCMKELIIRTRPDLFSRELQNVTDLSELSVQNIFI